MTQGEKILKYIEIFGSITPMDAFMELGITKLSTRVGELIRVGYPIDKELVRATNRFGDPIHYMRYSMKKGGSNG